VTLRKRLYAIALKPALVRTGISSRNSIGPIGKEFFHVGRFYWGLNQAQVQHLGLDLDVIGVGLRAWRLLPRAPKKPQVTASRLIRAACLSAVSSARAAAIATREADADHVKVKTEMLHLRLIETPIKAAYVEKLLCHGPDRISRRNSCSDQCRFNAIA